MEEKFSIKDYVVEVMLKPLPRTVLESAVKGGVAYLAVTGIIGIIGFICCKITERKENAA